MFLSSTTGPFLRPDLPDSTAPRTEAVKTGRRPPPQAAQCGLDGREHGVTLNQVGSARFLSRHPIRKGWPTDLPLARMVGSPITHCCRFAHDKGWTAVVKGFRMPASHCARGCMEAGVRKASKEETAGGVCAGGSVGLWGFKARFCATWPLSDGTAGLNG